MTTQHTPPTSSHFFMPHVVLKQIVQVRTDEHTHTHTHTHTSSSSEGGGGGGGELACVL